MSGNGRQEKSGSFSTGSLPARNGAAIGGGIIKRRQLVQLIRSDAVPATVQLPMRIHHGGNLGERKQEIYWPFSGIRWCFPAVRPHRQVALERCAAEPTAVISHQPTPAGAAWSHRIRMRESPQFIPCGALQIPTARSSCPPRNSTTTIASLELSFSADAELARHCGKRMTGAAHTGTRI